MIAFRPSALQTLFLLTAFVFVLHAVSIAGISVNPGSPDSINNLATARNIVRGRGYTSGIVHQYFVDQPVPGPETVRPPGIPYLVALCYWLFGVSLAVPILLNVFFLVGTAAWLRAGLRILGARWGADVAGLLALLTGAYEPHSLWNNNALSFCTTWLFWAGSLRLSERIGLLPFALLAGCIGAVGFMMKPTFALTVVPASVILLWFSAAAGRPAASAWRIRLTCTAVFLAVFAALTSPYWIRNLLLFGDPIYNPMRALRVVARYGSESGELVWPSGTWRTVRLGRPLTLGELAETAGLRWMLEREVQVVGQAAAKFWQVNPFVSVLALLCAAALAQRRMWLVLSFCGLLMTESLFSLFYISVSPRYLWAAHFCLVALLGLGLVQLGQRVRWLAVPLLVLAIGFGGNVAWRNQSMAARRATNTRGGFAELVNLEVPKDAVVLCDEPWVVWWYTGRSSVMAPTSGRAGMLTVLRRFRPSHFLYFGGKHSRGAPFLSQDDREFVGRSPSGRPWVLYRIRPETLDLPIDRRGLDPPLRIR